MLKLLKTSTIAFAIAATLGLNSMTTRAADLLTIGSAAPALDVEHWVQNGKGKFKPVTKFDTDKVYVVEFWATWCGPCVASMPHLAETQNKYADKGLQIVSISDEDLKTVESFLKQKVRGEEPAEGEEAKTYADLTSAYCLTTDPDGSVAADYMQAAAQNGIPTCFIVGKDSKIEWIGHPMEMDEPLVAVMEGKWDREAFAKTFKPQQEAAFATQAIYALLGDRKFDEALTKIDETIKSTDSMQMKMLKMQVLLSTDKADAAVAHAKSLFKDLAEDTSAVNMLAWNLFESSNQRPLNKEILNEALAATLAASEKSEKEDKASLLDTLAHLYFIKGDIDAAIQVEGEALKLTSERDREFIENFLKELKAAKEKADKKETTDK